MTLGSPYNPIILIVDGNLQISGTVTIYGFVFVTQTLSMDYDGMIFGAAAAEGTTVLSGSTRVFYDASILSLVRNMSPLPVL